MQSINEGQDTPHNRIIALKKHTHKDNIHLTSDGYQKLADSIMAEAVAMTSRPALPCPSRPNKSQ